MAVQPHHILRGAYILLRLHQRVVHLDFLIEVSRVEMQHIQQLFLLLPVVGVLAKDDAQRPGLPCDFVQLHKNYPLSLYNSDIVYSKIAGFAILIVIFAIYISIFALYNKGNKGRHVLRQPAQEL